MADGLYAALSGAVAQSRALEVLSSNLANTSTTGFKADKVAFKEVLLNAQGKPHDPPQRFVKLDAIVPDLTPGVLLATHNPLDLAIDGPGFFTVDTADGVRFTRAGDFKLSDEGLLVTKGGLPVLGENGEIRVRPDKAVRIDDKGRLFSGEHAVDKLLINHVPAGQLARHGSGLWRAEELEAVEQVNTRVRTGHLEQTNVNALSSMTELIWLSRAYEAFNKTIEINREIDRKTANELTI